MLYRGGLRLEGDSKAFGGFSSLRISPDGRQFVSITDRAHVLRGRLSYDRDGHLSAAADMQVTSLPLETAAGRNAGDSEGLAMLGTWPGDGWIISYERRHRLLRYNPDLSGTPMPLQTPPALSTLPDNEGIETLASLADGNLLLIAEAQAAQGLHSAWVGRPGAWRSFRYRARPPYVPVDATRLTNGDLLVLERRVSLTAGWGNRIVRVAAVDLDRAVATGGEVEGAEVGLLGPSNISDNFEGIDARRLPDGRVMVYLMSDDNFSPLQRTLLLMFELSAG